MDYPHSSAMQRWVHVHIGNYMCSHGGAVIAGLWHCLLRQCPLNGHILGWLLFIASTNDAQRTPLHSNFTRTGKESRRVGDLWASAAIALSEPSCHTLARAWQEPISMWSFWAGLKEKPGFAVSSCIFITASWKNISSMCPLLNVH